MAFCSRFLKLWYLLPREDEALLIRRDSLFILDLRFHVVDRVRAFHFKSDCLARQSFHENLHVTYSKLQGARGKRDCLRWVNNAVTGCIVS